MQIGKLLNHKNRRKTFLAILAFYLLLFLPFAYQQVQFALDKNVYYSFERGLSWLYRYNDPELFKDDIIADYREKSEPFFYSATEKVLVNYIDPFLLNRLYPLILWLLTAPLVYYAIRAIGGHYNALIGAGIYLLSQVFLNRMVGGLAHTFAFPMMWGFLCAMLNGKTYPATFVTVLSAVIYPVISPLLGVALAIWMLFPGFSRVMHSCTHSGWSVLKRLLWLGVSGALTLSALYINISVHIFEGDLGPILTQSDTELLTIAQRAYPSVVSVTHNPIVNMVVAFSNQFRGIFGWAVGAIFAIILAVYLFFGCTFKVFQDTRLQRMRPFAVSAIACLLILRFYDTTVIFRYIYYPLTLYFTLVMPFLFRKTAKVFAPRRRLAIFVSLVFVYIIMLSQPSAKGSGYSLEVEEDTRPILEYLATTPKDSLIAGMPNYIAKRPIEDVHYYARRKVLFADIYNNIFHRNFTAQMMKRLRATIAMYFATDITEVLRLRDEFGVDYMIVDLRDFTAGEELPVTYYIREDKEIERILRSTPASDFVMPQLARSPAAVFSSEQLYVIDLNAIPAPTQETKP